MHRVEAFLAEAASVLDRRLDELLPSETEEPVRLHSAIRWSTFAGGKRLRPALVLAVGQSFGASPERLHSTAAAVEMIHTFSLIHDDLPAMDDDDLRRGKQTCHKKFDEATAILAGDALQTLAFKTLTEDENLSTELRLHLIAGLAAATGTPLGMVAGQQLDLDAERIPNADANPEKIHALKTGALIAFSAKAGAKIANASADDFAAISTYADSLGLLFQITDDLIDVSQTSEVLGKTAGKDVASKKVTYPSVYGYDRARELAEEIHLRAIDATVPLGERGELLRAIAEYILNRVN